MLPENEKPEPLADATTLLGSALLLIICLGLLALAH